jgi:hypothetical protein
MIAYPHPNNRSEDQSRLRFSFRETQNASLTERRISMNRFFISLYNKYISRHKQNVDGDRVDELFDLFIAGAMLSTLPVIFAMTVTHSLKSPAGYTALAEFVLMFLLFISSPAK